MPLEWEAKAPGYSYGQLVPLFFRMVVEEAGPSMVLILLTMLIRPVRLLVLSPLPVH